MRSARFARRFSPSGHRFGVLALWSVTAVLACQKQGDATLPPHADLGAPSVAKDATKAGPKVPQVSDDPIVQKIVELGTTDSKVQDHLRHLTEEIGPRLTSSHNLMQAEQWARDQFASWGLDAKLEQWGEFPVGFDRGPSSGGMVAPETIAYDFTTRAWTPGVHGPARGRAVAYPASLREVKKNAARYENAWVVHPAAGGDRPDEKLRDRIDLALREAKILGHVQPARDEKGELVHTGGNYRISWDELPKDVRVSLRADQHKDLLERITGGKEVELEFSIDNRFFRGPVRQHNVIATIKGSEKPDEFVIIGGHIDSWDGATGTVDNGTGVSTTMEAARLLALAGAKPKRTIMFHLWSGEEQGLHGSKGYVDEHKEQMDKISAVLVHDGGTNYLSGLGVTPEMMPDMKKVFEPVTKLNGDLPFELVPTESLKGGGSDHTPFIRAGVPGFFWRQDGRSVYRCMHHTQLDTFETAVAEYQRHSAMVAAIAAYNIANLPGMLDRTNSKPIPRRQFGIELDGTKVKSVAKDGRAKKAGWRKGDQIVEIAGKKVESRRAMWRAMSDVAEKPKFVVKLERGGKIIDSELDFSEDEGEKERARRREERIAKFGEDAVKKPKREGNGIYGDPKASCKPGERGSEPSKIAPSAEQ